MRLVVPRHDASGIHNLEFRYTASRFNPARSSCQQELKFGLSSTMTERTPELTVSDRSSELRNDLATVTRGNATSDCQVQGFAD